MPGDHPLLVVVYLDDTNKYGDTWKLVLEDMCEAIKWLAIVIFMLHLLKIQLV